MTFWSLSFTAGGNQDGKFSVGFRDGVVRTVVSLDRETVASYALILEAIGESFSHFHESFELPVFDLSIPQLLLQTAISPLVWSSPRAFPSQFVPAPQYCSHLLGFSSVAANSSQATWHRQRSGHHIHLVHHPQSFKMMCLPAECLDIPPEQKKKVAYSEILGSQPYRCHIDAEGMLPHVYPPPPAVPCVKSQG